jgi:EAL domain-containing protein (putative c-di-GMP-specific phosphodiesterase class I)
LDVARVLGANSIEMAFQPIVMLESGAVIGYEALARFPGEDVVLPWPWFAAAAEQGLEQELELAAVREALARLDDLPDGAFVSINVTPLTAVHPIVAEMLAEVDVTRVVLEIKERATEGAHAQFARLFEELRATGVRIAVDNAGVSATNLRQILDVHPDIVKIDADITRGIHLDPVKQPPPSVRSPAGAGPSAWPKVSKQRPSGRPWNRSARWLARVTCSGARSIAVPYRASRNPELALAVARCGQSSSSMCPLMWRMRSPSKRKTTTPTPTPSAMSVSLKSEFERCALSVR